MARILVVDDQPELGELIQAILAGDGHAVEVVRDGQSALDQLAETVYDLVICDLTLPGVDGRAVYRAVEGLTSPRPVVLLMTGNADAPTYADFLQTTRAPVLSKPVGVEELREQVRRVLATR